MGKWWNFWHFKLQLGQFHPAGCVGWGIWVFQPAPHEMPSPAAGSSCHSAVHFLSDFPASPCLPWVAGWEESSTLQLPARMWRCQTGPSRGCFSSSAPFSFALIPEQVVDTINVFGTGLQGLEHAALCSLFPCSKLLLNFVWIDPVHTFPLSFQWGKSDQPLARERLLTSLLKQPSFLPLLHTHNFKTNVHLWCKICWSICFFLGALEKCDQCDEFVWVCLESVCARGWVQYANLQELLFTPMSRSILSLFCLHLPSQFLEAVLSVKGALP